MCIMCHPRLITHVYVSHAASPPTGMPRCSEYCIVMLVVDHTLDRDFENPFKPTDPALYSTRYHPVKVVAVQVAGPFIVDVDAVMPGVSLSIHAEKIVVDLPRAGAGAADKNFFKIDLSGRNGAPPARMQRQALPDSFTMTESGCYVRRDVSCNCTSEACVKDPEHCPCKYNAKINAWINSTSEGLDDQGKKAMYKERAMCTAGGRDVGESDKSLNLDLGRWTFSEHLQRRMRWEFQQAKTRWAAGSSVSQPGGTTGPTSPPAELLSQSDFCHSKEWLQIYSAACGCDNVSFGWVDSTTAEAAKKRQHDISWSPKDCGDKCKANNGAAGVDGAPGYPGQSAGNLSIHLLAEKDSVKKELSKLSVVVDGGAGGAAQNGQDGQDGGDGYSQPNYPLMVQSTMIAVPAPGISYDLYSIVPRYGSPTPNESTWSVPNDCSHAAGDFSQGLSEKAVAACGGNPALRCCRTTNEWGMWPPHYSYTDVSGGCEAKRGGLFNHHCTAWFPPTPGGDGGAPGVGGSGGKAGLEGGVSISVKGDVLSRSADLSQVFAAFSHKQGEGGAAGKPGRIGKGGRRGTKVVDPPNTSYGRDSNAAQAALDAMLNNPQKFPRDWSATPDGKDGRPAYLNNALWLGGGAGAPAEAVFANISAQSQSIAPVFGQDSSVLVDTGSMKLRWLQLLFDQLHDSALPGLRLGPMVEDAIVAYVEGDAANQISNIQTTETALGGNEGRELGGASFTKSFPKRFLQMFP